MLADERIRLLSEDPWTATSLAQVLFTMFGDDTSPVQLGQAATFDYTPVQAPLQITNAPASATSTPLVFGKRANGGSFSLSIQNGSIIIQDTNAQGQTTTTTGGGGSGSSPVAPASPATFPGQLIAYNGNNVYSVVIYPNGLTKASETVDVKQIMGNPLSPHAVDGHIWTMVTKLADGYYMNVPVWG